MAQLEGVMPVSAVEKESNSEQSANKDKEGRKISPCTCTLFECGGALASLNSY